jgi:ABC-type uncharacterized transport system permease subunit
MIGMLDKFLVAAVLAGTPLLFATLGEILSERVGHLNLGVEGMMSIGACAGFMTGYFTDSFALALTAAFISAAASALIYAFLTVTLFANQNVTGLTLTIFGVGLSNLIGVYMLGKTADKTLKLPEGITTHMRGGNLFGLKDVPFFGEVLFSYNPFVYLSIVCALALWLYLHHTKIGLNVRAIGENPAAADAAGINVIALKYFNITLGGGICGIAGAYCSMIINGGVWISNNVGGLGWIAVALVIFAGWKPLNAIVGSYIFGALRILKFYVPKSRLALPNAFYDMLPFLMTALVLVVSSVSKKKGSGMPQHLGLPYFREER